MGRMQGDLAQRSFEFAVSIMTLVDQLPNNRKGWEIARQLIRSGTSIGANVREADNAFSDGDFAYRRSIARKEAGETVYWLQLCERTGMLQGDLLDSASREAEELTRILSSIVKRTQQYMARDRRAPRSSPPSDSSTSR